VSFRIDRRTGQLTRAGLATGGSPAGLGVHPSGKFVLVADYGGGATLYEIATDGTPKNVQHVEAGALPHGAVFEGSGRFAYVTNSGSNSIQQFAFDGSRLAPLKPPTASFVDDEPVFQGMKEPRYLVATPDGRFVYVVGQRPPSVFQYTVGANGGLIKAARGVSALSGPLTSDLFGKDVLLAPDGEHLYATVYANDTIARFAVARPTGSLSFEASSSSGGMGPTQLAVDPAGEILFVALATSQRISSFRVAPSTGALTPASSVPSGGNAIAAFVLNE
jgi:6-phosphogluconolactonase (cycloisomerase 2 family)